MEACFFSQTKNQSFVVLTFHEDMFACEVLVYLTCMKLGRFFISENLFQYLLSSGKSFVSVEDSSLPFSQFFFLKYLSLRNWTSITPKFYLIYYLHTMLPLCHGTDRPIR